MTTGCATDPNWRRRRATSNGTQFERGWPAFWRAGRGPARAWQAKPPAPPGPPSAVLKCRNSRRRPGACATSTTHRCRGAGPRPAPAFFHTFSVSGGPRGISFSLSRAVVENGPDKLKLIPQRSQHPPETEALLQHAQPLGPGRRNDAARPSHPQESDRGRLTDASKLRHDGRCQVAELRRLFISGGTLDSHRRNAGNENGQVERW